MQERMDKLADALEAADGEIHELGEELAAARQRERACKAKQVQEHEEQEETRFKKGHYASQLEHANAQIRELYDHLLHKEALETLLVNSIEEFGCELGRIGDEIAQGKHMVTGGASTAGPVPWTIHPTTFFNLRNLCTKVKDGVITGVAHC